MRKLAPDYRLSETEVAQSIANTTQCPITWRLAQWIIAWEGLGRPYYDVYPGIVEMLVKCSLDFPATMLEKPSGLEHLYVRLPRQHQQHGKDRYVLRDEAGVEVRGLMISFQQVACSVGAEEIGPGLVIGVDYGETVMDMPLFNLQIFPLLPDKTVEQSLEILDRHWTTDLGVQPEAELHLRAVRTAVAICQLHSDPEILQPEVLSRDECRVNDENREKLLQRARKRGKYAFALGKDMIISPHLRRSHLATVWTGKGRRIPKIVLRKGSVIHRKKVEAVPTGYEVPENPKGKFTNDDDDL
jgi:hypothetical protein